MVTQQEIVENLKTTREKCGKIGHFPACCHTRQSQGGATVGGKAHRVRGGMDRNSGRGRGKQNVRSIEKRDTAVEESNTFYVFSVNPSAYVMPINIEEKSVSMIVDSGSSCNILPEATFRKMPGLKLRSCNSRVYAYASRSPLEVMGSCEVRMSVQGGGEVDAAQLLVVKGDHAALLGRKTAEELGVLRVGLAADVYFTGGLTKNKLREIYPQAFTGLGKLKNYQL